MDIQEHMQPGKLERYSFLWSEARLLIAALALFIGGVPPIYLIAPPSLFGIAQAGLIAASIISGLAAVYLLFRWYNNQMKILGGSDIKDILAFSVLVVSGLNLGLFGILGRNVGMSMLPGKLIFFLTGAVYLVVAYYLYKRWKSHGERLF